MAADDDDDDDDDDLHGTGSRRNVFYGADRSLRPYINYTYTSTLVLLHT